jgi:transglutaminase-like putative cysteine protease
MLTYRIFQIADGPQGTFETMQHAREMVIAAQLDPIVRSTALRIRNASMSSTTLDFGKAVWRWVRRRVWLVDEPVELIQPPEWLLHQLDSGHSQVDGDCDDIATLAAALIVALGIPVQFVAVKPAGVAAYMHLFIEMGYAGQWYIVDPTVVNIPGGHFDRMVLEV